MLLTYSSQPDFYPVLLSARQRPSTRLHPFSALPAGLLWGLRERLGGNDHDRLEVRFGGEVNYTETKQINF